ncbi:NAD(P)-dependent oxidoreductase [Dactylosporangium sp. CS-033363]|uniref:NAD(P)-dependent oxidoreductase n=1 Tax=Dactylosporangium sp. CS-033363 TaxID=3239935 RepID=UPI003D8AF15A
MAPDAEVTCLGPDDPVPPSATVLFSDRCPPLPALEWLQLGSHGYAQAEGVSALVTNASGVQDKPIAEWCVLMLLALYRNFPGMLAAQRSRHWDRSPVFQSELSGRRVGMLGYGNIGREVARHCAALGLEIWVMSRGGVKDRGPRYNAVEPLTPARTFELSEYRDFYAGLDALIVTTPMNAGTKRLVDAEALALLPRGALLLNPARAGVVDEQALVAALRSGHLGGAALDDHYRQPMPPDDPFWDLPNTIVTAHISGSNGSTHYLDRIWDLFLTNLRNYVTGAPMLNVVAQSDLRPF